jgi:hypothetical protein
MDLKSVLINQNHFTKTIYWHSKLQGFFTRFHRKILSNSWKSQKISKKNAKFKPNSAVGKIHSKGEKSNWNQKLDKFSKCPKITCSLVNILPKILLKSVTRSGEEEKAYMEGGGVIVQFVLRFRGKVKGVYNESESCIKGL